MNYTFFIHLAVLPDWLRLTRSERGKIAAEAFAPILQATGLHFRYFDAEAFTGDCTDIALFETEQIEEYYFALERLKDSVLFTHPYFKIVRIIPAIENGFQAYEQQLAHT